MLLHSLGCTRLHLVARLHRPLRPLMPDDRLSSSLGQLLVVHHVQFVTQSTKTWCSHMQSTKKEARAVNWCRHGRRVFNLCSHFYVLDSLERWCKFKQRCNVTVFEKTLSASNCPASIPLDLAIHGGIICFGKPSWQRTNECEFICNSLFRQLKSLTSPRVRQTKI